MEPHGDATGLLGPSERPEGVLVTVMTPTGREVASRSFEGVPVSYAPLDIVPAVRRALSALRPRALLLTETELWPNTVHECARAGIPVGMVNGRLSERSLARYLMPLSPLRGIALRLSFAACRSEDDAERYRRLGLDESRVEVVGDMKFDKLSAPLGDPERRALRQELGIPAGDAVVVFGSVRPREEAQVASAAAAVTRRFSDLHVVVAPRHLDRVGQVAAALASRGLAPRLRSQAGAPGAEESRATVVDTTGELARLYSLAAVAFVGGTLAPYGGHDPLEPAAQGVPVLVGPHTESCRDSVSRLLSSGGAFSVADGEELASVLVSLLEADEARAGAGRAALRAVETGRGATRRTLDFLTAMGVLDGAS